MDHMMNSLRHIVRRPIRTGLTILQVALGVAVTTALLSVLVSVTRNSNDLEAKYGDILIAECRRDNAGKNGWTAPPLLTPSTIGMMKKDIPALKTIVPIQGIWQIDLVDANKKYMALGSVAVGGALAELGMIRPIAGSFFVEADVLQKNRVVMVTTSLVRQLWGSGDPSSFVGKRLSLGRPSGSQTEPGVMENYRIVCVYDVAFGVSSPGFGDLERASLIFPPGLPASPQGYVTLGDRASTALVKAHTKRADEVARGLALFSTRQFQGDTAYIHTATTASALQRKMRAVRNNVALLGVLSAVAMVTASIGIFCNMMVDTVERTKEVGLLRALGASRRDILQLFVLESLALAFAGGVLGAAVSVSLSSRISEMVVGFDWVGTSYSYQGLEPLAVIVAVVLSLTIGCIFALYPAAQVSQMPPCEALREG